MLLAKLACLVLAGRLVVVEARVQGEAGEPRLGVELAQALGGLSGEQVAAGLAERLPPVAGGAKAEPVIEADRMVQQGRDAYLDGRFDEAATQLARARDVLKHAIESFEDERQAAETLFRAHMYFAFTLRAQGGNYLPQATEALKEAIRTFPHQEPTVREFGPENVKFYRSVRQQLEQGPTGQLRVRTTGEPANVYLNGRLVGVTPLDLRRVYTGRYMMHLRQASEPSRLHAVEVKAGDNEITIDLSFDHALVTERAAGLQYASAAVRKAQHARHAGQLARILEVGAILVYWNAAGRTHLALVDRESAARQLECAPEEAAKMAVELRAGRVGEMVKGEAAQPRRVWTWVAGGVAAATLVTGIILGVSSQSDFDSLKQKYPGGVVTDPTDLDLRDSGQSKQTAANVLFGLAGAAAVAGAALYFFEGRPGGERAQVVPVVGPRFAGAQWRLRF